MLEVRNLTVRYGTLAVVDGVSFAVSEGDWVMLTGPNGAGKSTILSAVTQGAPYEGSVRMNRKDIKKHTPRELAREIGVLTQNHFVGYAFTVEEIVALGRYAHSRGIFAARSDGDEQRIEEALRITGMTDFRKQSALTLSGGELQRTFLAQVFAQSPNLLLLDEPTNHLDLKYQKQTFALIAQWLKTPGRAVLSVVHDLSLARAYGTKALLLDGGKVAAQGDVREVLSAENLQKVYDMDVFSWMRKMLAQWEEPPKA
ncbi:MAG: ABC transporter ATP-binding protein [Christensenellales bacterium]|jgi:iron complex transport system ATP-binding protein